MVGAARAAREERVADDTFGSTLPNPPSSYVPGHIWFCLFDDEVGLLKGICKSQGDKVCTSAIKKLYP